MHAIVAGFNALLVPNLFNQAGKDRMFGCRRGSRFVRFSVTRTK